jgi:hypothetical protein
MRLGLWVKILMQLQLPFYTSVAEPEPEPHLLVGAGAVTRYGSGGSGSDGSGSNGSGSDNGIKHG